MNELTAQAFAVLEEAITLEKEARANVKRARRLLGAAFQERREALEVSASQFARIAGIDASEYWRLENAKLDYNPTSIVRRCREAMDRIERERIPELRVSA